MKGKIRALRKVIHVEGDAFVNTENGPVNIGPQKSAFTAYCKIVSITGDKEQVFVVMECAADGYKQTVRFAAPMSVADNAPNFIKQAYSFLKTQPEWADAADC